MIRLQGLCKTYHTKGKSKVVADHITCTFPSRTGVAILGRNGAGKSTLLRMIGGTLDPDAGTITRVGTVSALVGFGGSFHGDMTGAQNTRFVARISGVDTEELVAYVEDFAELGEHFYLPVRTYSSGMRARLAFGVSMGIKYDTYLVDEVTATGDAIFRAKSQAVFAERIKDSGLIFVTHSMSSARSICQHGAVLEGGKLTYYTDMDEAMKHHEENTRRLQAASGRG
ncbi:MAG: ABC transporter ATP-binding protein [Paracoccaceae bacterium]|nr:MAG: ABC transporter ATP-binding protein [Paracoccaceae bacterium]